MIKTSDLNGVHNTRDESSGVYAVRRLSTLLSNILSLTSIMSINISIIYPKCLRIAAAKAIPILLTRGGGYRDIRHKGYMI